MIASEKQKELFRKNILLLKEEVENWHKEAEKEGYTIDDVREIGITSAMGQKVVSIDAENLYCEISFPIRDWQVNPYGTCHGGMIATALDNALGGVAKWANLDNVVTTLNMNINYLKAVHNHENLIVKVKCISWGKVVMTLLGEAYEESTGILTNTVSATYRILPLDINL